jgi:hypothetical protein
MGYSRGIKITSCPLEAALSHTICINASQRSCPAIASFPDGLAITGEIVSGAQGVYVKGLHNVLIDCYEKGKMPHELGISWSVPGKVIYTDGRKHD